MSKKRRKKRKSKKYSFPKQDKPILSKHAATAIAVCAWLIPSPLSK